jgi:hypothetical protein
MYIYLCIYIYTYTETVDSQRDKLEANDTVQNLDKLEPETMDANLQEGSEKTEVLYTPEKMDQLQDSLESQQVW